MSASTPSTPRSNAENAGVSTLELLLAVAITTIAMMATTAFFHASVRFMRNQQRQIETTHTARAVIDTMVRDLRLGGACLPVTGSFVTLSGVDSGTEDEITTRTGLTRPDLSCVRTATPGDTPATGSSLVVEDVDGFIVGMRAYIQAPDGQGEFFNVTSINASTDTLGRDRNFTRDYPVTSGVYAMDERRFYIRHTDFPWGNAPELMMQIGETTAQSFAVGIEELDIQYVLRRNCPTCDVVDIPADDDEWRLVDEMRLTVTARSLRPSLDGTYYRRTLDVAVKPRNLLPK